MHTRYLQNHTYVVLCIAVLQCVLAEANILVCTVVPKSTPMQPCKLLCTVVVELVIHRHTDGNQANRTDVLSTWDVSE